MRHHHGPSAGRKERSGAPSIAAFETAPEWKDSAALYDAFAPDYDAVFAEPNHRKAYDSVAWHYVERSLPQTPGLIVDVGCGTGRWIGRLLSRGHRVIGVEQSPEMAKLLRSKQFGPGFELISRDMEAVHLEPASADFVMAMASVQYTKDPAAMIRRFAEWVKPGGSVSVMVDSLVALVLELIRMGKPDEALLRLRTGRGVFTFGSEQADLHLFDSAALQSLLAEAGLVEIVCHGLLVTSSAWGREGCSKAMAADEAGFLELERGLSGHPAMADAGKHLIASGRRPL